MRENITVRGRSIDLDRVYQRMQERAREAPDGRLVFDGGLKYILGEMFSLVADARTPRQPLADMRCETVLELRLLGWVHDTGGKNNGRYELTR